MYLFLFRLVVKINQPSIDNLASKPQSCEIGRSV